MKAASPDAKAPEAALLEVRGLRMHFPVKGGVFLTTKAWCKAVDGVDLRVRPGETLGLVGESGCGKSTLGKCVVQLHRPTAGSVHFDGREVSGLTRRQFLPYRRNIQMIFQDPAESLNARLTVGEILEEPFIIHRMHDGPGRRQAVARLLDLVGLPASSRDRYSFEFSGGQRQRIGIARAIALNPRLVICDEPVSALDVSVQSQILNLLLDLQRELNLAYLFIAHDLSVVRHISDRIAVMYLGRIVETAPADKLFANPLHAYTQALISAIPVPEPGRRRQRILLQGDVPSPINPPPGCAFAHRTFLPCTPEQAAQPGRFLEVEPGHWVEVHPGTVKDAAKWMAAAGISG